MLPDFAKSLNLTVVSTETNRDNDGQIERFVKKWQHCFPPKYVCICRAGNSLRLPFSWCPSTHFSVLSTQSLTTRYLLKEGKKKTYPMVFDTSKTELLHLHHCISSTLSCGDILVAYSRTFRSRIQLTV